jgi:hypothetical protein
VRAMRGNYVLQENRPIDIWEPIRPLRQAWIGIAALIYIDVHGAEDGCHNLMDVRADVLAYLLFGMVKQVRPIKYARVFSKEAEY